MESLIIITIFFSSFLISHQSSSVPATPVPSRQILNECNSATSDYLPCKPNDGGAAQCSTYAVLRTNSYYSSLTNLSLYLGLNPKVVAEATGFSATTQFLPKEQPLLLPIECKCSNFYQAELVRTTAKGDSLHSIAESLQGLTTCKAVVDKNPSTRALPFSDLENGAKIAIPIKCSCPTKLERESGIRFLISYPVRAGDTLVSVASYFKVSKEAVISSNNNGVKVTQPLVPYSTVLIPVTQKPAFGSLAGPREPKLGLTARPLPPRKSKKKKKKKKVMVGAISVAVVATAAIAIAAVLVTLQLKSKNNSSDEIRSKGKKQSSISSGEARQLNLSIRTTSEKKLSFEGSQSIVDGQVIDTRTVDSYTLEEINRATDDFNSHNLVEGTVYHGRIRGKDVAVKRTTKLYSTLSPAHKLNHPNILRLYGACFSDATQQSLLVLEYAQNGSLKDWIHGGLAVKSQFIASCSCFLTWTQRLRICLDVAMGLQYMHQIMTPPFIHRNIKTRNVFLDEEFRAKIGMAAMELDDNGNSWEKAYMAPELRKRGSTISTGVDVYAYGVVLMEVLSGEKVSEVALASESERVVVDSTLGESYSVEGAAAVAALARECVEEDPRMRPDAAEIVQRLSVLLEDGAVGERRLENEGSSNPLVEGLERLC